MNQGTYTGNGTTPPEPTWNGPADYTGPRNLLRRPMTFPPSGRMRSETPEPDAPTITGARDEKRVVDYSYNPSTTWVSAFVRPSGYATFVSDSPDIAAGDAVSLSCWVHSDRSTGPVQMGIRRHPGLGDDQTNAGALAAGWNYRTRAGMILPAGTQGLEVFNFDQGYTSTPDGLTVYVDGWMLVPGTVPADYRPHPADWYAHGMWWTCTGSGTIEGQAFTAGDRIYAIGDPDADYLLAGAVSFVVWSPPASTSLADLAVSAPIPSHGRPITAAGDRFVVEMLLTEHPGAVVGTAVVGETAVSREWWIDVTDHVHGVDVVSGAAAFAGDTETAVMTLELDSDGHRFAPWLRTLDSFHGAGRLFRPGRPIRAAVTSLDGSWSPIFSGEIETWVERIAGGTPSVLVVAADPWARLASAVVDEFAMSDNDLDVTLNALRAVAGHEWGADYFVGNNGDDFDLYGVFVTATVDNGSGGASYLDTASGTVADIIRTACKTYRLWARSDRYGRLKVGAQYPPIDGVRAFGVTQNQTTWSDPSAPSPFVVDVADLPTGDESTLETSSDLDGIVNHVATIGPRSIGFEGDWGTGMFETEDASSIARYGRRTLTEQTWYLDGEIAGALAIIEARRDLTLSIDRLELDLDHNGSTVWSVELGAPATITYEPPDAPSGVVFGGYVRSIRHRITPLRAGAADWSVELGVDTYTVEEITP